MAAIGMQRECPLSLLPCLDIGTSVSVGRHSLSSTRVVGADPHIRGLAHKTLASFYADMPKNAAYRCVTNEITNGTTPAEMPRRLAALPIGQFCRLRI